MNGEWGSQATPSGAITREDLVRVGPGTLCGRWLRRFWHPVLLERDLQPGQARPLKILGEDFTLYRGKSGTFYAVAFRCAHRGTQLSTGWVEEDTIRCFYHGWQYDGGGHCIEQPDEKPGLASGVRIRSYPVQSYLGMVFVYFGEGEPPKPPRFRNFEPADEEDFSAFRWNTYTWPCSFLNGQENDSYHGNWVHRDQYAAIGRLSEKGSMTVEVEETDYGFVSKIQREGARRFRETRTHTVMPNMRMRRASGGGRAKDGWQEAVRWSVPVDDDHFLNVSITRAHFQSEASRERYEAEQRQRRDELADLPSAVEIAEKVLRGEISQHDFPGKMGVLDPRMFNICDYVAQVGQGPQGILNDEHLGRTDVEVAMLRRIYRRELNALAHGLPLTAWSVPGDLAVRVTED